MGNKSEIDYVKVYGCCVSKHGPGGGGLITKVYVQYCLNCGGMSYPSIRLYDYKTWSLLSAYGMFKVVNKGVHVSEIIIDVVVRLNMRIVMLL